MIKDYFIFRNVIVENINESGLDIGTALFILKDIVHELEKTCGEQVQKEIALEAKKNDVSETDVPQDQ